MYKTTITVITDKKPRSKDFEALSDFFYGIDNGAVYCQDQKVNIEKIE